MMRIYTYLTLIAALLFTAGLNAQDIVHPTSGTQNFTVSTTGTTMYYDDGGENCDDEIPDGSYSNNADGTAVICPDQPNNFVQISFLEVDLEIRSISANPCWDFINIYDGQGTSNLLFSGCGEEGFQNCAGLPGDGGDAGGQEGGPNDMHGLNDGSPQNAVFTSTDPSGCLTVNFDSDGSVDEGGWIAEVTTVGGVASCTDGIQNGDETGVDCGGSCPPCDNGGGDDDDDDDNVGCTNVTVSITLDNFPGETSWQITSESGAVVASGGTYGSEPDGSTVTETVCLDDGCYEFTIFDSFGDGICCTYGPGSYTVSDDEGAVFASGGEFDDEETTSFCLGDCVPTATFEEVSSCATGRFYIRVDLTSLGTGSAVDITTNAGGRQYFGVDRLRTWIVGPYAAGTPVVVSVTNVDNPNCVLTSPVFDGDCIVPAPTCINGIAIELMPLDIDGDDISDTGIIEVSAIDFVASPPEDFVGSVTYSINRESEVNDIAQEYLILTCDDLGAPVVEIWGYDSAGNEGFCETTILVQDNMGVCQGAAAGGSVGVIDDEDNTPISNGKVSLPGGLFANEPEAKEGAYSFVGQAALFPNPSSGELNVSLSNFHGQAVEMVVHDAVGRVVATRRIDQVDSAVETFNLSNQQSGLYMMTIYGQESGDQITKRFIINK